MKTSIIIIGMALTLLSCSKDDSHQGTALEPYGGTAPIEADHRYNSAGRAYKEILDHFQNKGDHLTDRQKLSEEVFSTMVSLGARPDPSVQGTGTVGDGDPYKLQGIIDGSWLGYPAREQLRELVGEMPYLQRQGRQALLRFMDTYQKRVASSGMFSQAEKDVILTTASLFLYADGDPGDRPDKDWEISVGNMARVVEGALHDPDTAIYTLLLERLSSP
tara:strand:- start:47128 stop:47784 length:657 start_codon:yes stop_codon:yes gene_type:complete